VPEILNFSPEAKIIVMLRNPIDLIQSLHSLNVLMGIENIFDFEKAWGAEKERKGGKNLPMFCTEPKILLYSEWGKLGEQMERLLSHVKKGNLKIIIFDEFIKNTRQVYEEVLSFLGVPKDGRTKFTVINENRQINQTWLQIVFSFLIYYGLIIRAKF